MKQRFATAKEAESAGWFSRSHETREAHDAATANNKRSRQERALEQRREDLVMWQQRPESMMERCPEHKSLDVDQKIAQCKREIATLERRLGVVKSDA